jgi:membrane protease YdiL (CAAX protease family)
MPGRHLAPLEQARRLPGWLCAGALALSGGVAWAANALPQVPRALERVQQASGGWISPNTVLFAAILAGLALLARAGGARRDDVGLDPGLAPAAARLTGAVWAAATGATLAAAWMLGGGAALHPYWSTPGGAVVMGALLGALLGAAVEEIVFRGMLLPQLYTRFGRWEHRPRLRFAGALLLSQAAFGLVHIPSRMAAGRYDTAAAVVGDQVVLLLAGMFGAWIFLRSGNLYMAIGIHTLFNAPTTLFAAPAAAPWLGGRASILALGVAAVLVATWRRAPAPPAITLAGAVASPLPEHTPA